MSQVTSCRTNRRETAVISSCGEGLYDKNADDFHRPSVCIIESGIPALAAAVAAPIRKLCPQYQDAMADCTA